MLVLVLVLDATEIADSDSDRFSNFIAIGNPYRNHFSSIYLQFLNHFDRDSVRLRARAPVH
jgi:hypothetical protein